MPGLTLKPSACSDALLMTSTLSPGSDACQCGQLTGDRHVELPSQRRAARAPRPHLGEASPGTRNRRRRPWPEGEALVGDRVAPNVELMKVSFPSALVRPSDTSPPYPAASRPPTPPVKGSTIYRLVVHGAGCSQLVRTIRVVVVRHPAGPPPDRVHTRTQNRTAYRGTSTPRPRMRP